MDRDNFINYMKNIFNERRNINNKVDVDKNIKSYEMDDMIKKNKHNINETQVDKNINGEEPYLPYNFCGVPKLPSNHNIKFTNDMSEGIDIFVNKKNDMETRIINQKNVESLLIEVGSCANLNSEIFDDSKLRIFSIDDNQLDKKMSSIETLNGDLHTNLSCAIDTIIYPSSGNSLYVPKMKDRIRNWFPSLTKIGAESVEGYALQTSFSKNTDLFVMKVPRNPSNDGLIHEALIGFYALNKLRNILPNYAFVYGYTKCSPPAINDKHVVTWCNSINSSVSYLITEKIKNSTAFSDFIINPQTTVNDFLAVFLQIINALNLAYTTFGYTHYDLHYGNILIRKYEKQVAIPYFGSSPSVISYIYTKYIPYIIDYGYSRISIGGVGFGKISLEDFGLDSSQAFPLYDTYKILGFLGEKLFTSPRSLHYSDIAYSLDLLFSFFKQGSLFSRVQTRLSNINNNIGDWYDLHISHNHLTHNNYIDWLHTVNSLRFPIEFNINKLLNNNVIIAPINTKIDTCKFYQMLTTDDPIIDSLEYCDTINNINSDASLSSFYKQKAISWLNQHFDSEVYFSQSKSQMSQSISEATQIRLIFEIKHTHNIIPLLSSRSQLINQTFVTDYRQRFLNLLIIKDITTDLGSYITSNSCALQNQKKYHLFESKINFLKAEHLDLNNFIKQQRDILSRNSIFLQSFNLKKSSLNSKIINFWTIDHDNYLLSL